jgi:hypothetical protein
MTPSRYVLLASARVRHGYFADGLARRLRFTPDAHTQEAMRAHQLLLRSNGHGLALHASESALASLWAAHAPQALRFTLSCADPGFALYTEPGELPTLSLPLFGPAAGDEARWRLGLGAQTELQLQARRTIWKYLLLGDWQGHELQLLDPGAEVQFDAPDQETLPDGRAALVIRSRSALALAEHSPYRFQLRDAASQPPRLLMPRLPVAAPRGLQRELWPQGGSTAITEIFVSR